MSNFRELLFTLMSLGFAFVIYSPEEMANYTFQFMSMCQTQGTNFCATVCGSDFLISSFTRPAMQQYIIAKLNLN